MKPSMHKRWPGNLLMIALGCAVTAFASATALSSNPVVIAVRRGDCVAAVKLLNPDVASNDDQSAFLAGRMLDEGICVQKNPVAAAHFLARAADLGDHDAALDYAAKVGLGEGADQSYDRAGELCRAAGIDAQARLSRYSLGYACTVRSVAGQLLRETLPRGAFRPSSGVALVEFTPASAQLRIRTTPQVGLSDAPTGSNLRTPVVNAQQEIEKAWRDAIAAVPKPNAAQLDSQAIELPLDVDMTLEVGRDSRPKNGGQPFGSLFQGEMRPMGQ